MAALAELRPALRAVAPRLSSSFATSSRVGLDFTRPALASPSAPRMAAAVKEAKRMRWAPLSPDMYRTATGQAERAPTHQLSIMSSRNNVILTFADRIGPLFPSISGGTDKVFKKAQRSSFEAAHQAAIKMITRVSEVAREFSETQPERMYIMVTYNGVFGQGREAVTAAISGPDGAELRNLITRIEDRTPIKIGGTRPRAARRL